MAALLVLGMKMPAMRAAGGSSIKNRRLYRRMQEIEKLKSCRRSNARKSRILSIS
jgi:hypothetical protein